MDDTLRSYLNNLNRAFYETTALEFDQTRGQAWRGWQPVLTHLEAPSTVLDVGCGNGRFGIYLAHKLSAPFVYHGIDNNAALLEIAGQALDESARAGKLTALTLTNADLLDGLPTAAMGAYDLIALFGVIHHIPGYTARQTFMRTLAERLAPGGVLAFACWRFYEFERFRERILPWTAELAAQVERHDYLLDWRRGENAVRYCHYVDDDEHAALVRAAGLSEAATYRADGSTGMVNRYSILKKR
jgi:SAM-dependent methyltransferase